MLPKHFTNTVSGITLARVVSTVQTNKTNKQTYKQKKTLVALLLPSVQHLKSTRTALKEQNTIFYMSRIYILSGLKEIWGWERAPFQPEPYLYNLNHRMPFLIFFFFFFCTCPQIPGAFLARWISKFSCTIIFSYVKIPEVILAFTKKYLSKPWSNRSLLLLTTVRWKQS